MATATLSVSAIAAPGWKFTVFSSPNISDTPSIAFGQSPTVVTTDIVVFREFAIKDGVTTTHSITVSTNGMPTIFAGSDSDSLSFLYFFWDESTSAYGSTGVYSVNVFVPSESSYTSSLASNIWQWFYERGGNEGGGVMKRAKEYLEGQGYTGNINGAVFLWLGSLSISGVLSTRINTFERRFTKRHGP